MEIECKNNCPLCGKVIVFKLNVDKYQTEINERNTDQTKSPGDKKDG